MTYPPQFVASAGRNGDGRSGNPAANGAAPAFPPLMPSTVIRSFAYRPESRELDVLLTSGRRYVYAKVPPEAAEAFRGAFAKGRHFNARIRGRYAFREVEAADELNGG